MPKYSRTQKYEDLRARMQSDAETDVKSRDLDTFEKRLNQINSRNFAAPAKEPEEEKDPLHARRRSVYSQESGKTPVQPVKEVKEPGFNVPDFGKNENYTSAFNNEYLDEYIKEVKQYNKDNGNAYSLNTDLNVLKGLKEGTQEIPSKPYPDERSPKPEVIEKTRQYQAPSDRAASSDVPENGRKIANVNDFLDSLDDGKSSAKPQTSVDTGTMTRDDIAAEVQNLINSQNASGSTGEVKANTGGYRRSNYDDKTAREQLLNETTQMRAQLDDYEENLTDFNEKMRHTNKVLNTVLIVLIVALLVILLFVIFWILQTRGII